MTTPPITDELKEMQRRAYAEGLPIIRPDTVRALLGLLTRHRPLTILELGCAVGFSAAFFAEVLPMSKITTIDRYPLMIKAARANFEHLNLADRIELLEGDGLALLSRLKEQGRSFDMVFLDAAKGQYVKFYKLCKCLLRKDGLFIADDVLQGGMLSLPIEQVEKRQRTTYHNMREFINLALNDDEMRAEVIEVGDGPLVGVRL